MNDPNPEHIDDLRRVLSTFSDHETAAAGVHRMQNVAKALGVSAEEVVDITKAVFPDLAARLHLDPAPPAEGSA